MAFQSTTLYINKDNQSVITAASDEVSSLFSNSDSEHSAQLV